MVCINHLYLTFLDYIEDKLPGVINAYDNILLHGGCENRVPLLSLRDGDGVFSYYWNVFK